MPQLSSGIGRGLARFPPPSETSSMMDDQETVDSQPEITPLRLPGQRAPTQDHQGQRLPIKPGIAQEQFMDDVPREPPPRRQGDSMFGCKH